MDQTCRWCDGKGVYQTQPVLDREIETIVCTNCNSIGHEYASLFKANLKKTINQFDALMKALDAFEQKLKEMRK